VSAMWKPSQPGPVSSNFNPEPARPSMPPPPTPEPVRARTLPTTSGDQATIGKGLVIKGEITGTESLFIDGRVEGSINLPGNRVTVGANGQVSASMAVCITAREIVVMGKIHGNVSATDRVDIRSEGALTGDVSAARISIEDGAFFKGGIDIRKSEPAPAAPVIKSVVAPPEVLKPSQS
jgi:cytoskeletal protein CcmA (bactofilin family)